MEEWRDIEGYEGFYQVSSYGRVKSLERSVMSKNNSVAIKKEKLLKQLVDPRGYSSLSVALSVNNKIKRYIVARLVAIAFIENPNDWPLVEHIDDDPTNNHYENLKWGTPKSNAQAREKVAKRKVTKDQIDFIKSSNLSGPVLSKVFNISVRYVNQLKKEVIVQ